MPADEALRIEAAAWFAKVRGQHDAATDESFETWFAADPRHAEAFESVLAGWDATGLAAGRGEGEQRDRLAPYRSRRDLRRMLMVAASVIVGLVVFAGLTGHWSSARWTPPARQEQLANRDATMRAFVLPDGSRVTLDAGTRLDVQYTSSERRLRLEGGRARFDVAHDPDHPFIVTAGSREIVAHGTLFDVDLRGERPVVSLLRGSIEVRQVGDGGARMNLRPSGQFLVPGQQLSLAPDDKAPVPVPLRRDDVDWAAGMVSFEDQPLSAILAATNREGVERLVLADDGLRGLRYTGTLNTANPETVARMLAAAFDLDMRRDDKGAILLVADRSKKLPG